MLLFFYMPADGNADIGVFETVPGRPDRGKDIVIEGGAAPGIMKTWFFEAVKRCVCYVDTKGNPDLKMKLPADGPVSFNSKYLKDKEKTVLKDMVITFDQDYLRIGEDDYPDLREVVLWHEAMEFWYGVKPGPNLRDEDKFPGFAYAAQRQNFAHFLAMIEEYKYAGLIGKAERFKEFYQRKLEESNKDGGSLGKANSRAYEIVFEQENKGKLSEDLMENYTWLREEWEKIR